MLVLMFVGLPALGASSASSERMELNIEANDRSLSSSRTSSASSGGVSSSGGASRPSYKNSANQDHAN